MILGIDLGAKGALAFINPEGIVSYLQPIPLSAENLPLLPDIRSLVRAYKPTHAFAEKIHPFPGMGAKSMFTFGMGVGMIQGLLFELKIPHTLVTPQAWQKVMHQGVEQKYAVKHRSYIAAQRLFPAVEFTLPKAKNYHDGMVDACLIAEYGRRLLGHPQEVSGPRALPQSKPILIADPKLER